MQSYPLVVTVCLATANARASFRRLNYGILNIEEISVVVSAYGGRCVETMRMKEEMSDTPTAVLAGVYMQ